MFLIAALVISAIVVLHIILCLAENWDFVKKLLFVIATSFELVSKLLHWFTPITSPSAGVGNSAINPSVGLSPLRDAVSLPAYSPMLSSRLAQRCLLLDNAMLPESPRGGGVVVEIIDQGGIIVWVARERGRGSADTLAVFAPLAVSDWKHLERCLLSKHAPDTRLVRQVFQVVECEFWTNREEVDLLSWLVISNGQATWTM